MKILLHGCNGRMGQVITKILSEGNDMEIICGVDLMSDRLHNPYPVYSSLDNVKEKADVIIDFSNHSCIEKLVEYGVNTKTPMVICTTGLDEKDKALVEKASKSVPVLMSGNMSLGINLMLSLVQKAAQVLYGDFDVEIIEKHHNQKLDAPSGTALMIADAISSAAGVQPEYKYGRYGKSDKRTPSEIGIHSIRGGAIVGEHEAIFAGAGEVIEIKHTALSRDVFAYGAIKAASFLCGKEKGFYSMKDVIEG
jgi:4-hydroxy-tetrahydrodipicolinate reductase